MDLSEEVRAAHKRAFLKFFDQSEMNIELRKDIGTMINRQERRLIIKLSHFYNHREGADLARRLLQNPGEYMQPLCDSMTDMVRSSDAKYLKEGEQVLVGLDGRMRQRQIQPFLSSITACYMGGKQVCKSETLTIDFLKKYIHYAKHRIQPELTDEASDQIATAYAELRTASSNAKTGTGTLPITARTLETIIRLSTAHAKLKLRRQVLKSDVDVALQVPNLAIYHQELTEMEEREQEYERKRRADNNAGNTDTSQHEAGRNHTENGNASRESEAMEIEDPNGDDGNTSSERLEALSVAPGRHRHAQLR